MYLSKLLIKATLSSFCVNRVAIAMSTFVSHVNPITNNTEWIMRDENYDYHQEVARAAYADMLHDYEREPSMTLFVLVCYMNADHAVVGRTSPAIQVLSIYSQSACWCCGILAKNQMYYAALRDAVHIMHERGKKANVLDIGTGTGLLSMMAVRCGADSVTACEVFEPMAQCATNVIADNGMTDRIKLVRKRSTDLQVGPGKDLPQRANILVTEVFDTELIGEGAISTFRHAHQVLLEDDCIVVPSAANLYAQVVHSDQIMKWNTFASIRKPPVNIEPPTDVLICPGAPALQDLQLDQVKQDTFKAISEPICVFRFDYSGKSKIEFSGSSQWTVESLASGTCDAVFMWWDLEMDTRGKILLSCAPRWAHPTPNDMAWRDHWMQAIFYPPHQLTVEKGEEVNLHSFHDEYSLWFDVTRPGSENDAKREPPTCSCGAHIACSRPRIGMINDAGRNEKLIHALSQVITPDSVCLSISDGSMLPLMAAQLGAKKVFAVEPQRMCGQMIQKYVNHNGLSSKVKVISKKTDAITAEDLEHLKPTILLGEPFFSASVVPWHNIHFWYARSALNDLLPEKPSVLPCCATMRAIGVDFDHLWKIRAPVGNCEGFKLDTFDKIIETSSDIADNALEPQPLWEYPGKPVTEQFSVLQFDFTKNLHELRNLNRQGFVNLEVPGTCNGVAVWLDIHLGKKTIISNGLLSAPHPGQYLSWEQNAKQGVYLIKNPVTIAQDKETRPRLYYFVNFKPKLGEFEFVFDIRS